jgi:hypothetical protein
MAIPPRVKQKRQRSCGTRESQVVLSALLCARWSCTGEGEAGALMTPRYRAVTGGSGPYWL